MESKNEKGKKSRVANGVLVRAAKEDIDENGVFEYAGVTQLDENAFNGLQDSLTKLILPDLKRIKGKQGVFRNLTTLVCPKLLLDNDLIALLSNCMALRVLVISPKDITHHAAHLYESAVKNSPPEIIVFQDPVENVTLQKLNHYSEKLRNTTIVTAGNLLKSFMLIKEFLNQNVSKGLVNVLLNFYKESLLATKLTSMMPPIYTQYIAEIDQKQHLTKSTFQFWEEQKPLLSLTLPNAISIGFATFGRFNNLRGLSLPKVTHLKDCAISCGTLNILLVNHAVTMTKQALYECENLEILLLEGPVKQADIKRIHAELPDNLKNIKIVSAEDLFQRFMLVQKILKENLIEDVITIIEMFYKDLPLKGLVLDPFEALLLENVKDLSQPPYILNVKNYSAYIPLQVAIHQAQNAVNSYLTINQNKKDEGVARAKQFQYVIFSKNATPECLAIVIHAFLNEKTGGGFFGGMVFSSKGTALVDLLKTTIPHESQKIIGKVARYALKKMDMKTTTQQVTFENEILNNINKGKYDIPNLALTDVQILTVYGDRSMSHSQSAPIPKK